MLEPPPLVRPQVHVAAGPPERPLRLWWWAARVLDVVITVYAAVLLVVFAGGVNLAWLTARDAAKPLLILWVLIPIRVALGAGPWLGVSALARGCTAAGQHARALLQRIPPAVRDAAFAVAVTRIASVSIGFLVNVLLPSNRLRPFSLPFEQSRLAETFAAWDSGWYFDIAQRGYYYSLDGQSSVAFFPLYPMAIRALAWPFGGSDEALWAAAIAVPYAAFFGGLVAVHGLTERLFGDREIARRTVLLMAVYPFSIFMARAYPSSLFFLAVVLAVSSAYASRWWMAGLFGALATLTRPHGILIAVPLVALALLNHPRKGAAMRLAALTPIPLALAGFSVYAYSISGDWLAWLNAQRHWGFSIGHPPWQQLLGLIARIERHGLYDYFFTSDYAAYRLFHGGAALFQLAVTPFVFRILGAPLGLWVLASLLVPLSGNALEGVGRYGAVLFPVFMVLAAVPSRRFHEALLIVWSLFLALFVGLFVNWLPIY